MRSALLDVLADPETRRPLEPDSDALRAAGRTYPVRDEIPRFASAEGSFAFKWSRHDSYGSDAMRQMMGDWLCERYGFESLEALRAFFGARRWTLEAGVGAGVATSAWLTPGWTSGENAAYVGLDLTDAIDVARERLQAAERTHFVQADLMHPPFRDGAFDAIIAEGVLHHTPSTRDALAALVQILAPGGEILFYVYRRKGPLREYADDYLRERVSDLSEVEAWEALRPLTRLGQALAELDTVVEVPEDVPLLGIRAGRYDVQRLVYWHFLKLFWRDDYGFEESHHVNFDWYHPPFAHRHTEEEVRAWCSDLGLAIVRFDTQESGFSVRARRT